VRRCVRRTARVVTMSATAVIRQPCGRVGVWPRQRTSSGRQLRDPDTRHSRRAHACSRSIQRDCDSGARRPSSAVAPHNRTSGCHLKHLRTKRGMSEDLRECAWRPAVRTRIRKGDNTKNGNHGEKVHQNRMSLHSSELHAPTKSREESTHFATLHAPTLQLCMHTRRYSLSKGAKKVTRVKRANVG
jgi:hypothetical protein